jgi:hypothetical protein
MESCAAVGECSVQLTAKRVLITSEAIRLKLAIIVVNGLAD